MQLSNFVVVVLSFLALVRTFYDGCDGGIVSAIEFGIISETNELPASFLYQFLRQLPMSTTGSWYVRI